MANMKHVEAWMKCFDCMEHKVEELKKEYPKVAELWSAKLEKCKACKDEYYADTEKYRKVTLTEVWANYLRRCTSCLLDDLERIAKYPEEAKVYAELSKACTTCMYGEMPEIVEEEVIKA